MKWKSKRRVYDGEDVTDALLRIPWLQQFLLYRDDFAVQMHPQWRGDTINRYVGYKMVAFGGIITVEMVNEILRFGRKHKHMKNMQIVAKYGW